MMIDDAPLAPSRDVIAQGGYLFLGSRLKRLAEQMQADVSRVTRGAGINVFPGQFPLLAILHEQGPQTVGALSAALGLSQPVTTRNVTKLVEAGFVTSDRSSSDGRSKCVTLTAAGEQAMDRSKKTILPHVEAAVQQIAERTSGPLLTQLAEIERALATASLYDRTCALAARELQPAGEADIPLIVTMMNEAYRGLGASASWTTETPYITGDRITEPLLRADMAAKPAASLLTWRDASHDALKGSVWLEPLEDETWYLGSLTVDRQRHNAGLGHALLYCAEQWIRQQGGQRVRLTVINVRESLIAWYVRRGYALTGDIEPFPYDDLRFGKPLRDDLSFVVLQKDLHVAQ